MQKNLLTNPPKYHRELFNRTELEGRILRTPKESFYLSDLLAYMAISFSPVAINSSFITQDQADRLRNSAIESAPELTEESRDKLLSLVETHGLEIVLYAIDMTPSDQKYPSIEDIKENIRDAEVILAQLERDKLYGLG
jgi:hypothetical protein